MKSCLLLPACIVAASCAATDPMAEIRREEAMVASIEETYVYLDTVKANQVPQMRHTKPFRWEYLNDLFVVIDEGSTKYLLEFRERCEELGLDDIYNDMVDLRQQTGSLRILRPGIDTIRGCTIKKIYKLPRVVAEEEAGEEEDENE